MFIFRIKERVITKIIKTPGFKKTKGGPRRVVKGKKSTPADVLAKGKTKKGSKATVTTQELDTDLESYMKGNKHPRVSAAE